MSVIEFMKQPIPIDRVQALTELLTHCAKVNVNPKAVCFYQNGFYVTFEDLPGDVILHDGSYGHDYCAWETYGMPWDDSNVSVHDSKTLALLLGALKSGEDWKQIEQMIRKD